MRRKRQFHWVALTKLERGLRVVIYEPLRKKEIAHKVKQGWKVV
ncbi:hypothetical protein [Bacillus sp. B15-48]|nr:hypothetical protein [Bacillus sp. B15-48]